MIDSYGARAKARRLIGSLSEERRALLGGEFLKLGKVAAHREAVLETLESGSPVAKKILREKLPEIRALALRNLGLLDAALAGIKSAQKSLAELEGGASEIETYTEHGKKRSFIQKRPLKDHRI